MGCAFSRKRRRIEKNDAPSFTYYVNGGGSEERKFGTISDVGGGIDAFVISKGSEMNSFLGKAGGKAVEVLDTLGSSMSTLSSGGGFKSSTASRGFKISILAFEVANTIAKGSKLLQSLSKEDIHFLKKEILPSQGVQNLVSSDNLELLNIISDDKRDELHLFSVEITRFGDLCKDPQWHNLTRYFQKLNSDPTPPESLRKEAELTMQELVALVQHTSELYHEFHAFDRLQQDYKEKLREEDLLPVSQRGDGLLTSHNELKHQKKIVKNLKKKSLWSRNMEEIVEKLVEVVVFMHKEIGAVFGHSGNASSCMPQKLGTCCLDLHYANIINRIENIVCINVVSRPISMPSNTRDVLYNGLPMSVKAAFRSRLQSFQTELTVNQIKIEMQKILQWLGPLAENTIKAHQGFGWVGEWANMGTEVNKKPMQQNVPRILTLYHADKNKIDEYILQLVVWLHFLVALVKSRGNASKSFKFASPQLSKKLVLFQGAKENAYPSCSSNMAVEKLNKEDKKMFEQVDCERVILVRSRSHGFQSIDPGRKKKRQHSWHGNSFLNLDVLSRWNSDDVKRSV